MKTRLDIELSKRGLVTTRSQAESYIKLGRVKVNGQIVVKPGHFVQGNDKITLSADEQYVSRAGLKLANANRKFKIDFTAKVVLDVGSSTGGFSDYALQNGAKKVIAIDVGTGQLHSKLRAVEQIELHEKTDIRDFKPRVVPDIVLVDASFISLRYILPHLVQISSKDTLILAMVKPQFEAGKEQINRGVIKNERMRRQILKDFENWVKKLFKVVDKIDSDIAGVKGNVERFYLLRVSKRAVII